MGNVKTLTNHIRRSLGNSALETSRAWRTNFWYMSAEEIVRVQEPPSDLMELCWTQVIDLYVLHQHTWDNGEEIEIITAELEQEQIVQHHRQHANLQENIDDDDNVEEMVDVMED